MKKKYVTKSIAGIITQIAKPTSVEGYTEGVMESFLPETDNMTAKECDKWIRENNKRMKAICKLLNDNNL
jgi:hypothetical protein